VSHPAVSACEPAERIPALPPGLLPLVKELENELEVEGKHEGKRSESITLSLVDLISLSLNYNPQETSLNTLSDLEGKISENHIISHRNKRIAKELKNPQRLSI
jgi:hypothetical protein